MKYFKKHSLCDQVDIIACINEYSSHFSKLISKKNDNLQYFRNKSMEKLF